MKPISNRLWWHMAPAATALVLFCGLAIAVATGLTDPVDTMLRNAAHGLASPSVTDFMGAITHLGSVAVIAPLSVAALAILAASRRRSAAWLLVWTMAGSVILENGLKFAFHRMRPEPFFGLSAPDTFSFPSGHALFSTCFYGVVALIVANLASGRFSRLAIWTIATGLIATVCFSRVYLGVHYPTDVLGGVLAAIFWIAAVCGYTAWRSSPPGLSDRVSL